MLYNTFTNKIKNKVSIIFILFEEQILFPFYWTAQYLETILIDLNYLIVVMFNVLVFDNLFGPYVK